MVASRLLPFQPPSMTAAQLATVCFLARHSRHTHDLHAYQLRRWFAWCGSNGSEVDEAEAHYKRALLTRQIGLNRK